MNRVASLRERREEKRGGNDAPWKAWNPANRDPTLSTGLGNPAKNQSAGFPHFHRAGGGFHFQGRGEEKMKSKLNSS
jgi:hypothetical protein